MSVLLYERPIARQIVFNHALEPFMKVDPPDRSHTPILPYLEKSPEARAKTGEELDPFLELLIYVEPPNFSFSVEFISDTELDEKQWRKVGKCVNAHLREFEADIHPDMVGHLFHPHKDFDLERKIREIWIRTDCALQLRECFPEIKAELRRMMKENKLTAAMVAEKFGITVKQVENGFFAAKSGRLQPATIAKNILLASDLAEVAGIYTLDELEHDVLYQKKTSNILPHLKRIFGRVLVSDGSDPMKTPFV